jgi:hypothetical protein
MRLSEIRERRTLSDVKRDCRLLDFEGRVGGGPHASTQALGFTVLFHLNDVMLVNDKASCCSRFFSASLSVGLAMREENCRTSE